MFVNSRELNNIKSVLRKITHNNGFDGDARMNV